MCIQLHIIIIKIIIIITCNKVVDKTKEEKIKTKKKNHYNILIKI